MDEQWFEYKGKDITLTNILKDMEKRIDGLKKYVSLQSALNDKFIKINDDFRKAFKEVVKISDFLDKLNIESRIQRIEKVATLQYNIDELVRVLEDLEGPERLDNYYKLQDYYKSVDKIIEEIMEES